jgi:N-acyl-D-aspartate/D-glutamate deacylase
MNNNTLDNNWETLIKNAAVYDGSGEQPFIADVAIKEKHIAAVGTLEGTANVTIHANHRALAPSFIDVHTHDDFAVLCCPDMDFKILQGVTTEIVGNCGFGAAPFHAAQPLRGLYPKMDLPPFDGYMGYVNALKDTPPQHQCRFFSRPWHVT